MATDPLLEQYIAEFQARMAFREQLGMKFLGDPTARQEVYDDWQPVMDWLATRADRACDD